MSHHRPSKKARSLAVVALVAAAASTVAGCVEPRAKSDATIDVTWVDDVAPLFAERCVSCHAGATPSANYRLDAYCEPALPSYEICAGVLGPGADETANVVVGEGALESRLLAVFEGDSPAAVQHREALAGGEGEAAYADRLRLLERWVATDAPYFLSSIHSAEVLDPRQTGFHGRDIAAADWQMGSCRSCHGEDYRGGTVGVSCLTCHRQPTGPEACDTCHGTGALGTPPPGLDADDPAGPHQQHLVDAGTRFVAVDCEECHHVPRRFDDPSHIEANPDGRAEIFFGPNAGARNTPAAYDPATKSCVVACHGAGLADATMPEPAWELDSGLGCGSCHGTPPRTAGDGEEHALSPRCEECHEVRTGTGAPFPPPAPERHGDGVITVLPRVTVANCEGCHSGTEPAGAFRDNAGNTDPTDPQAGAHTAHLAGSFNSVGMGCEACHVVPATVGAHPHVDAVAGAEVVFGEVARAGGLQPTYDAAARTCSNTWCHGAGVAGGQTVSPAWTNPANLGCTGCHAMPPDIPAHRTGTGALVETCGGGCHGAVIDDAFNWTNQSLHVNGQVNLGD